MARKDKLPVEKAVVGVTFFVRPSERFLWTLVFRRQHLSETIRRLLRREVARRVPPNGHSQ